MKISISKMNTDSKGKIIEIKGGMGMHRKLNNMGIIEGKEIIKVSSLLFRGPVIIRIGNTEVAIGYGMASKIIVETME